MNTTVKAIATDESSLTLTQQQTWRLIGVGKTTFFRMLKAASFGPSPLKLNGAIRYRRQEVIAWIDAGAPSREVWEQIRQQGQLLGDISAQKPSGQNQ